MSYLFYFTNLEFLEKYAETNFAFDFEMTEMSKHYEPENIFDKKFNVRFAFDENDKKTPKLITVLFNRHTTERVEKIKQLLPKNIEIIEERRFHTLEEYVVEELPVINLESYLNRPCEYPRESYKKGNK